MHEGFVQRSHATTWIASAVALALAASVAASAVAEEAEAEEVSASAAFSSVSDDDATAKLPPPERCSRWRGHTTSCPNAPVALRLPKDQPRGLKEQQRAAQTTT